MGKELEKEKTVIIDDPMTPVPLNQRQHWTAPAFIFGGLEFSVTLLKIGSTLIGAFGLKGIIPVVLFTFICLTWVGNAISGYMGAKTGLSSSVIAKQGFGDKLGADLPGEKRWLIPNAQFYEKAYRGHWNGLTVISISIGQGEILSTPLQIANLGATIANRGYFVTPHIVKEIQYNQVDSIYRVPRYSTIEKRHYESVVEGMRGAATGGTCRMLSVMVPDLEACGKTGTAQNRGHDHSVFMGFAPMNNPKIAFAVYVENGGWGATYGVPFGALMMEQYLKGKLSPENELRAEEFSNRVILYGNEER